MNIPTFSLNTFHRLAIEALSMTNKLIEQMKDQAAQIVTGYYEALGYEMTDNMMNVEVSFDGTWLTRGYSSLIALGFVVEVETGIILDFEVLNKYCNVCAQHKKKEKQMTPQEIIQWKEEHKASCEANYDITKSSFSMEGEIADILFKRSKERNLRYTKILSDEDSSTYNRLLKLNPYGNKYPIKKKNCLNHINKKNIQKTRQT